MDYYKKYLKYKTKYLKLIEIINKNRSQIGGDVPLILRPDRINLFINGDMEKYLNPIYGYVMYKSMAFT